MTGQHSRWQLEAPPVETRKAFVLWVSRERGDGPAAIEGRVEEVDTGVERRFRSAEQLIAFLEECLGGPEV